MRVYGCCHEQKYDVKCRKLFYRWFDSDPRLPSASSRTCDRHILKLTFNRVDVGSSGSSEAFGCAAAGVC